METCASCMMCGWFVMVFFVVSLTGGLLSQNRGVDGGRLVTGAVINFVTSAFAILPLLTFMFEFWYSRRADLGEVTKREKKLAKGKQHSWQYRVPFPWYEEWKEAGSPQFPEDDPTLTEAELRAQHQTVTDQINAAISGLVNTALQNVDAQRFAQQMQAATVQMTQPPTTVQTAPVHGGAAVPAGYPAQPPHAGYYQQQPQQPNPQADLVAGIGQFAGGLLNSLSMAAQPAQVPQQQYYYQPGTQPQTHFTQVPVAPVMVVPVTGTTGASASPAP